MAKPNLEKHFSPKNVAIVGATEKGLWTYGFLNNCDPSKSCLIDNVFLVNPNRHEVFGRRCFSSLTEITADVDHVVALVNASLLPGVLEDCVTKGVHAITAVASGLEDRSTQSSKINDYITKTCDENNITFQGPNCFGFNNYSGAFVSRYGVDHSPADGNIGVIVHSGQVGAAIADSASARGIKLSYLVSSGNELVLDTNDYIEYFLDKGIGVIGCFLEQIPNPKRFMRLADRARDQQVPIIVIATGRTEAARRIAVSHTGAVAGGDAVTSAFLRRAGCIRVESPEELVETAGILANCGVPAGNKVFYCGFSGGAAELYAEEAEGTHLQFKQPSSQTVERIVEATGLKRENIHNPLDMTLDGARNFDTLMRALASDPEVDILVAQGQPLRGGIPDSRKAIREPREQAFFDALDSSDAFGLLHETGDTQPGIEVYNHEPAAPVHYVFGQNGIKALSNAIAYRRLMRESESRKSNEAEARQPLENNKIFTETESKALMASFGVPVTEDVLVKSAKEAAQQFGLFSSRVVMKVVSEEVPHKSDVGGVVLGVASPSQAEEAYESIISNVSSSVPEAHIGGVIMSEQLDEAVEAFVGVNVDPALGPAVVVGLGGVFIEIFADVSTRMAPVNEQEAIEMLRELKAWPLLEGARGHQPLDFEALAKVVVQVSEFAVVHGEQLKEVDLNPVFVLPNGEGVKAVDALVRT